MRCLFVAGFFLCWARASQVEVIQPTVVVTQPSYVRHEAAPLVYHQAPQPVYVQQGYSAQQGYAAQGYNAQPVYYQQ